MTAGLERLSGPMLGLDPRSRSEKAAPVMHSASLSYDEHIASRKAFGAYLDLAIGIRRDHCDRADAFIAEIRSRLQENSSQLDRRAVYRRLSNVTAEERSGSAPWSPCATVVKTSQQTRQGTLLECEECGRPSDRDELGWTLRFGEDEQLYAFCPRCDQREFG